MKEHAMTTSDIEQKPRLMLTIPEAAEMLAISRSTLYQLVGAGALATVSIGRLRRIPADELVDFIGRLRREQAVLGG
jgi:excisionase family DNA binding protein